jgi:hypothetical protein
VEGEFSGVRRHGFLRSSRWTWPGGIMLVVERVGS